MMWAFPEIPTTDKHVLIAGPTACGKSALALKIAERDGGIIVNADALQVFANWRVLTARPDDADVARISHQLYGHIPGDVPYSVGQWLRELRQLLQSGQRLIITGGTGLYFSALTEGLADIPATPENIRHRADNILASQGHGALLEDLDADTLTRIDQQNPVRVQRAWEVQKSTGHGLAHWQDTTPPPTLPLEKAQTILLNADKDWLNHRIAQRFDAMLDNGALDEARQNLSTWSPGHPSSKAIGASQLIAHLKGEILLDEARDSATIATRQFAKRQRSWFRSRMAGWNVLQIP